MIVRNSETSGLRSFSVSAICTFPINVNEINENIAVTFTRVAINHIAYVSKDYKFTFQCHYNFS